MTTSISIAKIVSGGQAGADRAALDVALRYGFPHSGWCPKNRKSEDGRIGGQYRLTETQSRGCLQRNRWNVRDSDGTVVVTLGNEVTGGSLRTVQFCRELGKPYVHISRDGRYDDPAVL